MRVLVVAFIAFVVGIASANAAAAWKEYVYLDRGFAIQFPVPPKATAGTYQSTLAKGLKTDIYSAEDDHVIYRMTVVDLTGRNEAGVNFLGEAAYNLMRTGDVIFNDVPRVYQDVKAIYGSTLVVDQMDGKRVRTSLYYNKGHLYIAEAILLPERGDKDMIVPSRFDQTVRFPPDGRFD